MDRSRADPSSWVGDVNLLMLKQRLWNEAQQWARGEKLDRSAVDEAMDRALVDLHRRYSARIPVYRRLVQQLGMESETDPQVIAAELSFASEVFKSYDPDWLASGDFRAMTRWLATLFVRDPCPDPKDVNDLETWRSRLRDDGVYLTYSTGSSGWPSFVPRDRVTLSALISQGELYRRLPWGRQPDRFDCLVLTDAGMGLGIQAPARGLAEQAERVHRFTPPGEVVHRRVAFEFLDSASKEGRPVLVFGTPFQVESLCGVAPGQLGRRLQPESLVVMGGGWKSHRALSFEALAGLVTQEFGLAPERVMDTYGAAELNFYLKRCPFGRYHVPPTVRAMVFDDMMQPLQGEDLTGSLVFLDPNALSYPGFVMPGDIGRLVDSACPCGLHGPAIDGSIERAPFAAPRGCATAMAPVSS